MNVNPFNYPMGAVAIENPPKIHKGKLRHRQAQ
jgi:hypothetical protein